MLDPRATMWILTACWREAKYAQILRAETDSLGEMLALKIWQVHLEITRFSPEFATGLALLSGENAQCLR